MIRQAIATLVVGALLLLAAHGQARAQSSVVYGYDDLGRVVSATTSTGQTTYTYDKADNRTQTTMSIVADGTVLFSSTTPGTWSYTVAPGVAAIDIEIWGGGGGSTSNIRQGGHGAGGPAAGIPGGGGGYSKKHILGPSGTLSGSLGGGGTGGPPSPTCPTPPGGCSGTAGTATTVTSPALTANGGGAGNSNGAGSTPPTVGAGGTATGGDTNTTGNPGVYSQFATSPGGGAGNGGGNGDGTVPGGGGAGQYLTSPSNGHPGANGRVTITARSS